MFVWFFHLASVRRRRGGGRQGKGRGGAKGRERDEEAAVAPYQKEELPSAGGNRKQQNWSLKPSLTGLQLVSFQTDQPTLYNSANPLTLWRLIVCMPVPANCFLCGCKEIYIYRTRIVKERALMKWEEKVQRERKMLQTRLSFNSVRLRLCPIALYKLIYLWISPSPIYILPLYVYFSLSPCPFLLSMCVRACVGSARGLPFIYSNFPSPPPPWQQHRFSPFI